MCFRCYCYYRCSVAVVHVVVHVVVHLVARVAVRVAVRVVHLSEAQISNRYVSIQYTSALYEKPAAADAFPCEAAASMHQDQGTHVEA